MKAKRAKPRRAVHPVQPAWVSGREPWNIKFPASQPKVSLRKLAAGQQCYLPMDQCNPQETVVLAHIRRGHVAGMGQKPADVCAIPMCHRHHAIYDGREKSFLKRSELDAWALNGLCRWLAYLWNNGYLHT